MISLCSLLSLVPRLSALRKDTRPTNMISCAKRFCPQPIIMPFRSLKSACPRKLGSEQRVPTFWGLHTSAISVPSIVLIQSQSNFLPYKVRLRSCLTENTLRGASVRAKWVILGKPYDPLCNMLGVV